MRHEIYVKKKLRIQLLINYELWALFKFHSVTEWGVIRETNRAPVSLFVVLKISKKRKMFWTIQTN